MKTHSENGENVTKHKVKKQDLKLMFYLQVYKRHILKIMKKIYLNVHIVLLIPKI